MQLCKGLNCFLKTHNKQLNQYYCNFIVLYPKKKKSFKKWFGLWVVLWVGSCWLAKKKSWVTGQPIFASGQKMGLESGRVRKFWPVLPCLILTYYFFSTIYNRENKNCGKKLSINFLNQCENVIPIKKKGLEYKIGKI